MRTVVGREIVIYLAERGSADLAAARPLLESVVGTLIQTEPFQRVFRAAALEANRVFFVREQGERPPRSWRRRPDRRVRAEVGLAEPREAAAGRPQAGPVGAARPRVRGHHAANRRPGARARHRPSAARCPAAGRRRGGGPGPAHCGPPRRGGGRRCRGAHARRPAGPQGAHTCGRLRGGRGDRRGGARGGLRAVRRLPRRPRHMGPAAGAARAWRWRPRRRHSTRRTSRPPRSA